MEGSVCILCIVCLDSEHIYVDVILVNRLVHVFYENPPLGIL